MSKDTRSALTRKLIKQLNYNKKNILVSAALVEHELGRVLMLWSPKLIATVDAADIELPCVGVDGPELYKALEIADSFEDAIKLSVNTDDDGDPPEIPLTPVMDAWTPELSAICKLASTNKIHSTTRPNLAVVERVEGGSLCITDGFSLYEVDAGDIPEGFTLPAYLAHGVEGLRTHIDPQFVSFGRHDGGEFVSVAAVTTCGRLCTLSMLYYKSDYGKYPTVSQVYRNFLTEDKRLHAYTLDKHAIKKLRKKLKTYADVTSTHPKDDMIVEFDYRAPGDVVLCTSSQDKENQESYALAEFDNPVVQKGCDDLTAEEIGEGAKEVSAVRVAPNYLYTALSAAGSAEINIAFYSRHAVSLNLDVDGVSARGLFMPRNG